MKIVLITALLTFNMLAAVSSFPTCNIPSAPADASPALAACLSTYGHVNLVGFYQLNTTLVMPQGSVLSADRGSFNNALTAGPSLSGPMILLDSRVSSVVDSIQLILPNNSTTAGGILITNTTWNSQFNRVTNCYLEDQSNGTKGRYGIKLHSIGNWQIAYNKIENNTVFQFHTAIHTLSALTNAYPVTANRFTGNQTSGVFNLMLDAGTQQSSIQDHFCNGWANAPSAPTCLTMGNPISAGGTVHENRISVHSDITGSFTFQGTSYRMFNNATKNVIEMFSSDGNGIPAAPTNGLPAVIGNANTILYK